MKPYIGGINAVHRTPLLFRPGTKERPAVHHCAGAGCVTCLWASYGVFRSYLGWWFGWTADGRSVVIDDDRAACVVLPEELGLI